MISCSLDRSLPHFPFALVTPFDFVTKSEYSVSRGGWATCAAGGQIFILRTVIWGTRGVKGKAHCAISLVSHPFDSPLGFARGFGKTGQALAQRTRKGWATL
jgi:hypothetical protein